ncbi:thioredoxin family protein [Maribacter sp. CXY002]|uniref:thioredoxin family protein n=1 Tax=Maribacter luteocoastalis TaxID=3407671 RepID=UPI003B674AE2
MDTKVKTVNAKSTVDLVNKALTKAISYREYRDLVNRLVLENKPTGPNQTDSYIHYTQLNTHRMKRWDKVLKFDQESVQKINQLNEKLDWLVLTESWCGDASPALPLMNKIAEINPNIKLKIILRDENLELMQQFLTQGALSIPKLIQININTNEVIGTWGPRSTKATKLVEDYKAEHGMLSAEFKESLQLWYNKDKGQSILEDLLELFPLK